MYADLWIIEWREPGCDDVVRTATTAEDAVEIIQRMLENETAFDEAGDDDRPAFDAFFDGEEPIRKLRNLFEATRQECDNGTLLVRRAIEMKTPKSSPVERTNQFEKGKCRITEKLVRKVKEDFLEWSGGDPPESEMQIFVYVEYARTIEDEEAVRAILRDWDNEDSDAVDSMGVSADPPLLRWNSANDSSKS